MTVLFGTPSGTADGIPLTGPRIASKYSSLVYLGGRPGRETFRKLNFSAVCVTYTEPSTRCSLCGLAVSLPVTVGAEVADWSPGHHDERKIVHIRGLWWRRL